MQVQSYLMFDGRCEEAIEFYRNALGAEVELLMRMKDSPHASTGNIAPGTEHNVMHSEFRIGDTTIMATDGAPCEGGYGGRPDFKGFSLTLPAENDDAAARLFAVLSDGGKVRQPLTRTFFSSSFGIVADRFGVSWMVLVAPDQADA